ncbi:DUF6134 family protein [Variovorax sp. RHLX14]|uniref:DUF6134 family protein n=1 Tax=Variovorax sp. RHLX14 TaxID=1259731 RepID=UPI003F47798F
MSAVRAAVFGVAAMLTAGAGHSAEPGAGAGAGEWNFQVTLDDKPIGTHRFSVTAEGADMRKVVSDAAFTVKLLGLTVYRYRHQATEQWRGDCLRALSSSTDDDGEASRVRAVGESDGLRVSTEAPASVTPAVPPVQTLGGCVMSFAYWNPAMRSQTQLLNAQTGRYEAVKIAEAGRGSAESFVLRGQSVSATRWRIEGPVQPVDVWYTAQGEWVGLDSTVGGGRKLKYRLR